MPHLTHICRTEEETIELGQTLARCLQPGDLVALNGDLGTGKTTFARALIRTASEDDFTEVPSPTFTLVQTYEDVSLAGTRGDIAHFDLYRMEDGAELEELGLLEALENGIALVEWPQKAEGFLPAPTVDIIIEHAESDERVFSFFGQECAINRVARSIKIRQFLNRNGYQGAARRHLTGDASARSYETIFFGDETTSVILMNAPATPDGPIVKDGKPYSQIAHLAEDISAFVGVAHKLSQGGLRVPQIIHHDFEQGLLLIENLGSASIITADRQPIEERYLASMETLATIHNQQWSANCPLPEKKDHIIPSFDRGALMIEVELLTERYAPYVLGAPLSNEAVNTYHAIWNSLIDRLDSAEQSIVLRDYHSPNIIWMDGQEGTDRTGLIDFQDAVMGPSAYDVASIAQDARIDISASLEQKLVDHYCAHRKNFDEIGFREAYAIMAAERASKVLGIFVRLSQRDGKHQYLPHLPRIEEYLSRSLSHPALADYRAWVNNEIENKRD